jgi:hypothetical protein
MPVMPVKTGIQQFICFLDSRFRENDGIIRLLDAFEE